MASRGEPHVLIIVQNLPVPLDRRVWLEAKALREVGFEVSVISPKGRRSDASHEVLQGVHIYRYWLPVSGRGAIGYLLEFVYAWLATFLLSLRASARRWVNIVHACNPPETFFLLGLFYKLFGSRFVFDHHDLSPEMFAAKYGRKGGALYSLLLLLERATYRTADLVIEVNESQARIARTRGRVRPERIRVVRSGPDFERLRLLPEEPELRAGKKYLVCYLGEMCPQDGVDYLLRAIRHYRNALGRDDARFVLMGGGPALEELKSLKEKLQLDGAVEFTGRVSDHDLCRYLSTADLCVDPDPWSEWADKSTMNKIMEYMAFGKPIVAFDLTEARVSAGQAARFVRPNDEAEFAKAMAELLDDPDRRRQMGEYGLRRVRERLAWDYSKRILQEAYAQFFLSGKDGRSVDG